MNCKEFEKVIPPFINDELTDEMLPDFISHIKSCKECEEELAIQYLTTEGLIRLEEGAAFSLDQELSLKVGKASRRLRMIHKIEKICSYIEIALIIILLLTLLSLFI